MNPRRSCGLHRVHKTPSELQLRDYEIVWILGGGAGEKEGNASVERVRSLVDSLGGKVGEVNPWGKRNLAYPIEKETEGLLRRSTIQARCRTNSLNLNKHSTQIDRLFAI